jgi:hypothetical protein
MAEASLPAVENIPAISPPKAYEPARKLISELERLITIPAEIPAIAPPEILPYLAQKSIATTDKILPIESEPIVMLENDSIIMQSESTRQEISGIDNIPRLFVP